MRQFACAMMFILLLPAVWSTDEEIDTESEPESGNVTGEVPWQAEDFAAGIELAQEADKPMLAVFGKENCGHCKKLMSQVLANPKMQDLLQQVVLINVDLDSDEGKSLSAEYRASSSPTCVLFNTDIHEIDRIVGFEELEEFHRVLGEYLQDINTVADYERRLLANPDDVKLTFDLGYKYVTQRNPARAFPLLQKVVKMDPENHAGLTDDALYEHGAYLHKYMGRAAAAAPYLRQVLDRYPDGDKVYYSFYRLTRCLAEMRQPRAIVEVAETFGDKLPEQAKVHRTIAKTFAENWTKTDEFLPLAERSARKAVALDPSDWSHYVLALVLERTGDLEGAREAVATAIKLNPQRPMYTQLQRKLKAE